MYVGDWDNNVFLVEYFFVLNIFLVHLFYHFRPLLKKYVENLSKIDFVIAANQILDPRGSASSTVCETFPCPRIRPGKIPNWTLFSRSFIENVGKNNKNDQIILFQGDENAVNGAIKQKMLLLVINTFYQNNHFLWVV